MALGTALAGSVLATAFAPVASAQAQPTSASPQRRHYGIPPGSLDEVLGRFGAQSGLMIAMDATLTAGLRSPALEGDFTVEEALAKLLAPHGLDAVRGAGGGYRLVRKPADGAVAPPPPAPRPSAARASRQPRQEGDPTTLDAVEVWGQGAQRIGENRNIDIVRTTSDAQAYYIFDSATIAQSGVANVEEFLKQRLTMNTQANLFSQQESQMGNASQVNLRGLGTDKTLILVNGRRMGGPTLYGSTSQPDVNAIPAAMIDHIEVLPTSSSGIYGGGAIGGVVNIILKKDYTGNEFKLAYENAFDTDVYTRTVSFSSGFALNGGRTHLAWSAQHQDGSEMLFRDRSEVTVRNLRRVQANEPTYPVLGSTTNVTSMDGTGLVLKDGTALGSAITHIDPGTSPGTSMAELYAMLLRNSGSYNTDYPDTIQSYGGLRRVMQQPPKNESFMASIRHEFSPDIEGYVDVSYAKNAGRTRVTQIYWDEILSSASPSSPFAHDVYVRWPDTTEPEEISTVLNRNVSAGILAKLPGTWEAMLDYTVASSAYSNFWASVDYAAQDAALQNGSFNPLIDTMLYPQNFSRLLTWVYPPRTQANLHDLSLRATGPVFSLPWGNVANLTAGLTYRSEGYDTATGHTDYGVTDADDNSFTYFGKSQNVKTAYLELLTPLVKPANAVPLVHTLDLQLAVRAEKYSVDTGTIRDTCYYNRIPAVCTFSPASAEPYSSKASYEATSPTVAIKYQPVESLLLRASYSEAFLPPTFSQLLPNDQPNATPTTILDPVTGATYDVSTVSGGNPELTPLGAESWNYGFVWTPGGALQGLRAGLEHYRIVQDDIIGALSAQSILQMESRFPERVTRDPATGRVTLINTSSMNLTRYETKGWDLSLDWVKPTSAGTLSLNFLGTYIQSENRQFTVDGPSGDYAGYVSEGGPLKFKANLNLGWQYGNWFLTWSTRYFDSYYQAYAAGSPYYVQYPNAARNAYYTNAQGGDKVASQIYHDAMVTYSFDQGGKAEGLTLQAGVKNVFDRVPSFDAWNGYGWYSRLGDLRLRTYYLSVQKRF